VRLDPKTAPAGAYTLNTVDKPVGDMSKAELVELVKYLLGGRELRTADGRPAL